MTDDMLREAAERMAVSDVLHRYATAIDTKEFSLLEQVFDEQVETDFTGFGGAKGSYGRDEWIASVQKTVGGLDATQHLTGNHVHRIDGDRAHLNAYLQALHRFSGAHADPDYIIGGHYDIDLVRRPEGWRICGYKLTVTWERGNRYIMREAAKAAR